MVEALLFVLIVRIARTTISTSICRMRLSIEEEKIEGGQRKRVGPSLSRLLYARTHTHTHTREYSQSYGYYTKIQMIDQACWIEDRMRGPLTAIIS